MDENHTVSVSKESMWKYTTMVLGAIVLIGALYVMVGGSSTGNTIAGSAVGVIDNDDLTDDDAVKGDEDAPVTIVEFSDYECPFCGRWFLQTYPQLKKEYIDTGKVKMVFRDFPLSFHKNAQMASEAAECVRDKGGDTAYWAFHDILFTKQAQLSEANVKTWAKEQGYDVTDCLAKGTFRKEVLADLADGQAAGVQGTPAFFINGKLISGAQPFAVFKQAIDAAL
ncbi:DsbA family protein [Candidatus Pacearchaeota archaeon]|nr:DsbA family protein [Candidatus Pacearchaeota archaeon]